MINKAGTYHSFILSGLSAGKTNYFKAKAVGSGITSYGDVKSFTTSANSVPPWLRTLDASKITDTSVTLGMALDNPGSAAQASVSIVYGTTEACADGETITKTSRGNYEYLPFNLSNLKPGTLYYYRAKAVGTGTSYGDIKKFTTTGNQ